MYNEFLLAPVLVAINSVAGASLSSWLWKQGRKGCVHPPGHWYGFPIVYLSVSPRHLKFLSRLYNSQKGGNKVGIKLIFITLGNKTRYPRSTWFSLLTMRQPEQ